MRKDLLKIVCCPEDKANLFLEHEKLDDHGDVRSGTLRCIECGFGYPIEDGIPNLLPPQYHINAGTKGKQKPSAKAGKDARQAPREDEDKAPSGRAGPASSHSDAADKPASRAKPKP